MTDRDDLTRHSAAELGLLIRAREVSCAEVVQACLQRIESLNPEINAFCTVTAEQALEEARQADRAVNRGKALGPLHGIPVGLKDLTPTRGVRTTRGSRLFRDHVPEDDALLVRRIRQAGGVIVGKTNTPEFGHKGVTDNLVFGPTRNPWNRECTAGGSSGGSAAAVAARMVPLAEGSDGAGSIRIPASLCGVFGFKPGYGRVPDVVGPFSGHSPFFHNGPLARTVTDAALLYTVMAGPDAGHPFSMPFPDPPLPGLEQGIEGLRIGYSADLGYFQVDDEIRDATADAAGRFAELGAEVEEFDLGLSPDLERQFMVLWCAKMATAYGELSQRELDLLEPRVQALIEEGKRLSAVDYGRANLARETVWQRMCEAHRRYDLIASPTTAVAAFPLADGAPQAIAGRAVDPLIGWFLTYPINMTGHPAASLPCGLSTRGLPIGLQLVGSHLEDNRVLRASRAYERAYPWPMAPD